MCRCSRICFLDQWPDGVDEILSSHCNVLFGLDDECRLFFALPNHQSTINQGMTLDRLLSRHWIELLAIAQYHNVIDTTLKLP